MIRQIRKSETVNGVAVPYTMLERFVKALDAAGIKATRIIERPYVQLEASVRETIMADLDAANITERRVVVEATANADDMRAFVRDRLSECARSEQIVASTPCDKALSCNTLYSELISCYYDSVAHGDAATAAGEREALHDMWAEYEQTMLAAIDYARKIDDIASELAFMPLLEDTKNRLLADGIIEPSM